MSEPSEKSSIVVIVFYNVSAEPQCRETRMGSTPASAFITLIPITHSAVTCFPVMLSISLLSISVHSRLSLVYTRLPSTSSR